VLRTHIRDVSGGGVTLTRLERQVLINQFETLSTLRGERTHEAKEYGEKIEILRCGYEVLYGEAFTTYPDDEVLSHEEGRLVIDVLNMYSAIHFYQEKHSDEEIERMRHSHFEGFDGNNESSHLGFTRFLIEKQGKWSELRAYAKDNDNFNSHRQNIATYRQMLAKWSALGHQHRYEMTRESLVAVLETVQPRRPG